MVGKVSLSKVKKFRQVNLPLKELFHKKKKPLPLESGFSLPTCLFLEF